MQAATTAAGNQAIQNLLGCVKKLARSAPPKDRQVVMQQISATAKLVGTAGTRAASAPASASTGFPATGVAPMTFYQMTAGAMMPGATVAF
ncbi:MAG: hypothetical protein QGI41_10525, partial [Acidimicrobiales bacterium]|nr:hypothetical protein [Acidimicrobiales bacterium]